MWSVAKCDDYIVLPYGILAVILFYTITGAIVAVASFARCMFAPEYEIYSV